MLDTQHRWPKCRVQYGGGVVAVPLAVHIADDTQNNTIYRFGIYGASLAACSPNVVYEYTSVDTPCLSNF